jgi:hypothetical protein
MGRGHGALFGMENCEFSMPYYYKYIMLYHYKSIMVEYKHTNNWISGPALRSENSFRRDVLPFEKSERALARQLRRGLCFLFTG